MLSNPRGVYASAALFNWRFAMHYVGAFDARIVAFQGYAMCGRHKIG